ncbi:MAG: hypothetical protein CMO01_26770 [Thalassobius sp.]|nr:hypothetical protein [Thalassovita sp.]
MYKQMRIYHRYLGFFLAGIMAVYAISGIVMIFRDTTLFMKDTTVTQVLPENTTLENLGQALRIRRFSVEKVEGNVAYFKEGTYDTSTRTAVYTKSELPFVLEKITSMHKATSSRPLFFLNIFFGLSLLFFVISAFWMFMPSTSVFKKGLYFSLAGLVLALIVIFV